MHTHTERDILPFRYCLGLQIMAKRQPFVFMKLQFKLLSGETATVTTDSSWLAFNADTHRRPVHHSLPSP